MDTAFVGQLAGGVGLFVLGMRLLTDGLRMAAGHALRGILARWTDTPLRGVLSGVLITSLVQSSGAVTIATIGFVNAGLITLAQAVAVVCGTNVGTTMTGWIVALVGGGLDLQALALPMIGIGMVWRLALDRHRVGHIGEVLAGLGLFFLGIDVLQRGFVGVGNGLLFGSLGAEAPTSLLLHFGLGFLFTVLMQSSSAAIAMILTAASSGVLSLHDAAAMVVGANVGTTSTAALSVIGATPNAKRTAAAHVIFNAVTGSLALLILPWLVESILMLRELAGIGQHPASTLALFHTLFNVMGVLLFWPFLGRLAEGLGRLFRSAEEDEARPKYLDRNTLATPLLALDALTQELGRIGAIARRLSKSAISIEVAPGHVHENDRFIIDRLVDAAGDFCTQLQRRHLPPELDRRLPAALRVSRYYSEQAELASEVAHAQAAQLAIGYGPIAEEIARFKGAVVEFLDQTDVANPAFSTQLTDQRLGALKDAYQTLKGHLLRVGAEGHIPVRRMVEELDALSNVRRIAEQAKKAADYLVSVAAVANAAPAETAAADGPPR